MREVLTATGAPRGSVYHHFAGGKADLVARAIDFVDKSVIDVLTALRGRSSVDVIAGLAAMRRAALVASDLTSGCAIAAVTIAARRRASRVDRSDRSRLRSVAPGVGSRLRSTHGQVEVGGDLVERVDDPLCAGDEESAFARYQHRSGECACDLRPAVPDFRGWVHR